MQSFAAAIQNRQAVLEKRAAHKIRSERDELIQRFLGRGIKIRANKKLRDATLEEIVFILKDYKTNELHPLCRSCESANSFPRLFWFLVKQHKNKQKSS